MINVHTASTLKSYLQLLLSEVFANSMRGRGHMKKILPKYYNCYYFDQSFGRKCLKTR